VLVALDLYTTYLSTPNLVFEANPIIIRFDLNWLQIILVAAFFTVLMSVAFVYALEYIRTQFQTNSSNRVVKVPDLRNKKMLLSFFIIGSFFTHLTCTVFVVINNYFGYLFLFGIRNSWHSTAVTYITVKTLLQSLFFFSIYSSLVQFSFLCAFVIIVLNGLLAQFNDNTPQMTI
jgi:hypothetical protein